MSEKMKASYIEELAELHYLITGIFDEPRIAGHDVLPVLNGSNYERE
jgi:hypothetical protein